MPAKARKFSEDPEEWEVKLTLTNKDTDSSDILNLTFDIAQVNLDLSHKQYDCILLTIDLKGKPIAEDDQIWILDKASVMVGEEDEEEHLYLSNIVLKSTGDDTYIAKATVGEGEKKVLTTQEWVD